MYWNISTFSRFLLLIGFGLHAAAGGAAGQIIDFEDLTPGIPYTGPGGGFYENGANLAPISTSPSDWDTTVHHSVFTSGGITFANDHDPTFSSWIGWAYSNTTDTTTEGWGNQYSAFAGGGYGGSANYAVYFDGFEGPRPTVTGIPPGMLQGAYFTNTTYAALAMRDGDAFAFPFDAGDWFKLMITGLDADGQATGTVDFYLADYTTTDEADWYIIDDWTWVDLSGLGNATQLQFELDSSDHDPFGMVTPAYFAMDNLTLIPEPTSLLMLLCGSAAIAVGFGRRRRVR